MTEPQSRLLTTGEVAEAFRVNPRTIYRWTESGKLPYACLTPGGQYRYSETTIEIMMSTHQLPVFRRKPNRKPKGTTNE